MKNYFSGIFPFLFLLFLRQQILKVLGKLVSQLPMHGLNFFSAMSRYHYNLDTH